MRFWLLYLLYFTKQEKPVQNIKSIPVAKDTVTKSYSMLPIAVVNIDSLLRKYDYYNYLEDELKKKQANLENALQSRAKAFEEEYMKFLEKAQRGTFLSDERAAEEEERLKNEQQEIMKYEQSLNQEMMDESQKIEKKLFDTVTNYLKQFNSDGRYEYILNKAGCLYNNDYVDITDTVIKVLNERYKIYKDALKILKK
ncbi:MAG: OmpH family outer membrane protein [Bacteroidia bacterium]|nr:OmpH family outer membrane protein [Bacteroidia bacterium]